MADELGPVWSEWERWRREEAERAAAAKAPSLLLAENVDGAEVLIWCDRLSDAQAAEADGFIAVALPGGLGVSRAGDPLKAHAEALQRVPRHYLAVVEPLRAELARRLGRHVCWTVELPRPGGWVAAVAARKPFPIEGLHKVEAGTLAALKRRPPPAVMTTGAEATDAMLRLPADGRCIVVTGFPSHGKTAWVRFVMIHTCSTHGRRWAVFSPEMQPWEQFAAMCAETLIGAPFWAESGLLPMDDKQVAEAEAWLADRLTMIVADSEDVAPTLDWLIEKARESVIRDGATDVLIDPWNEVEHQRATTVTETDYIGRSLQKLKAFALRHGCNIWIIAHPAKPLPLKSGEVRAAPGPYDISSSAHWNNKPDVGLTVHSPEQGTARVVLWKARFRRWGKRGDSAELHFDPVTGRYRGSAPTGGSGEDWYQR